MIFINWEIEEVGGNNDDDDDDDSYDDNDDDDDNGELHRQAMCFHLLALI